MQRCKINLLFKNPHQVQIKSVKRAVVPKQEWFKSNQMRWKNTMNNPNQMSATTS